jgi:hypothetical protein
MTIWGVANPLPLPINFTPGSDVPVPNGSTQTVAIGSALVSSAGMHVWPYCLFTAVFTMGAVAPSALVLTVNITGISTIGSLTVNPGLLVALAVFQVTGYIFGTQSRSTFLAPGIGLTFLVDATGQDITFNAAGSSLIEGLAGFAES